MYAQNIEGGSWKGEKIDKGKIDKMSGIWDSYSKDLSGQLMRVRADQQLGQLYELMQAIQKQAHEDGGEES